MPVYERTVYMVRTADGLRPLPFAFCKTATGPCMEIWGGINFKTADVTVADDPVRRVDEIREIPYHMRNSMFQDEFGIVLNGGSYFAGDKA